MKPEDIAACVDATAAALELPIDPAHRPGVLAYFTMAADMAGGLMAFPLGTEDESGAVFRPVSPVSPRPDDPA